MRKVLIVHDAADVCEAVESLRDAGWDVTTARDASAAGGTEADAVVLAAAAGELASALEQVAAVRADSRVPVVLVADLDRSGWDRTFGSAEALDVDALLDMPVDTDALRRRLDGILAARKSAQAAAADPQMAEILDRAIAGEEASEAFYRRAAASVTQPDSREALESLMRDEAEHKRLLEEFRAGKRSLPDAAPPAGSILEAFGAPEFSAEMSPADAFLLAANKEKLAVQMYENWAKLYPEGPERKLLLRLAEIERAHKAKVEAMFTNAAFPEVW
jgi:rubrerythrin